jgi:hypothetical protein
MPVQAYFGPLGHHARTFAAFLGSVPGVAPLPKSTNPAGAWEHGALLNAETAASRFRGA